MRRLILLVGCCIVTWCVIFGPKVYQETQVGNLRSDSSPNQMWSVRLLKAWRGGEVVVWVEAYDRNGQFSGKVEIQKFEHWEEPDLHYDSIDCRNDFLRIHDVLFDKQIDIPRSAFVKQENALLQ